MDKKSNIATKVLVKPTVTSDQDDFIEEVVEEKENNSNGDESQEIVRDLTKQLFDLEDKFVKGKADNFSKNGIMRKLLENISTITNKFVGQVWQSIRSREHSQTEEGTKIGEKKHLLTSQGRLLQEIGTRSVNDPGEIGTGSVNDPGLEFPSQLYSNIQYNTMTNRIIKITKIIKITRRTRIIKFGTVVEVKEEGVAHEQIHAWEQMLVIPPVGRVMHDESVCSEGGYKIWDEKPEFINLEHRMSNVTVNRDSQGTFIDCAKLRDRPIVSVPKRLRLHPQFVHAQRRTVRETLL